ncbi:hypothetical protein B0H63DRAFT_66677 [Podospora didyma]|uniref:Heterokaryon incompatibility domain-containing protein n=1 Tax=Podospora didyma TaxID=330526 RepID=A0AAE0P928_9PEZI|nr:hypothetical protein B0H63DRAFT_66677 [Podospora didyma]
MHRIFAGADQVIVWLGEATADSNLAFEFAKEVSKTIILEDNCIPLPLSLSTEGFLSTSYLPSWSALHRLLTLGWWERAWVVQEISVAKSVLVLCGSASIDWYCLGKAIILADGTIVGYEVLIEAVLGLWFRASDLHRLEAFTLTHVRHGYKAATASDSAFSSSGLVLNHFHCNRLRLCKLDHDRNSFYWLSHRKISVTQFLSTTTGQLTTYSDRLSKSLSKPLRAWISFSIHIVQHGNLISLRGSLTGESERVEMLIISGTRLRGHTKNPLPSLIRISPK